jgi:hypothetical protein
LGWCGFFQRRFGVPRENHSNDCVNVNGTYCA